MIPLRNTGHKSRERRRLVGRDNSADSDLAPRIDAIETALAGVSEALDRIEKQVVRANREQFKSNLQAEAHQKSADQMLEQLKAAGSRREDEMAQLKERSQLALEQATLKSRVSLIEKVLPIIDSLDEAIASYRGLQNRAEFQRSERPASPPVGFWQRLTGKLPPPEQVEIPFAALKWLDGIFHIREQLTEMLRSEGIVPIETVDRPFDPAYHIAVQVEPANEGIPDGWIVRERRRGYLRKDTVFRYAEVVVARGRERQQP